jgi:hypothetical protein
MLLVVKLFTASNSALLSRQLACAVLLLSATGLAAQNYSLSFDGNDDYVTCGNGTSVQITGTALTLEAWVHPTAWKTSSFEGSIVTKQGSGSDGYVLRAGASGTVSFAIGDGSAWHEALSASGALALNRWQHVAGTYDGTTLRIFVDGKQVATQSASASITSSSDALVIGSSAGYLTSREWQGYIDEVRVWNTTRKPQQLLDNMYQSLAGSESGLQAYYRMTNGSGTTVTDNTSNANTGTATAAVTWYTTTTSRILSTTADMLRVVRPGNALDFDGTDDYVSIAHSGVHNPATALTVEAWVNLATPASNQKIVSKSNGTSTGYILGVNSSGIYVDVWNSLGLHYTLSAGSSITADTWTHLAFTWAQNGSLIGYINGIQVGSTSGGGRALGGATEALTIGKASWASSNYADGMIDEVRIWNTARTSAEIQDNMNSAFAGTESGLLAYYRFDDVSGTVLEDLTSNNLDGTLTNMDADDWADATGREPLKPWTSGGNWTANDTWLLGTAPSSSISNTERIDICRNTTVNSVACYTGNILIRSGVTLTVTTGQTLNLNGDCITNGTITGTGTSATRYQGSVAQLLTGSGTYTIPTFRINNASGLTLDLNVTVTNNLLLESGAINMGDQTLTLNGGITQSGGSIVGSSSSSLTIGGATSTAQLPPMTIGNLTINRANGVRLTGDMRLEGVLTFTNGRMDLNNFNLTMGPSASVAGTPSASRMIRAETGEVRKEFTSQGAFTYPIGDDNLIYSPVTLTFSGGTYGPGAYASVRVYPLVHGDNASPDHYISRYWDISASGLSGFSCQVSCVYDDSDMWGDESNYKSARWDGTSWNILGDVDAINNRVYGSVSGFSDFTAGQSEGLFPVEWLSFHAEAQTSQVDLSWATGSELNSARFEIERSADAQSWSRIGSVAAAGNSSSIRHYSFSDRAPLDGRNLYRLRQIDQDGQYDFSSVVEITFDAAANLLIFPSPARQVLNVRSGWQQADAEIWDMQGRKLMQQPLAEGENQISLHQMPGGYYLLRVITPDGRGYDYSFEKR